MSSESLATPGDLISGYARALRLVFCVYGGDIIHYAYVNRTERISVGVTALFCSPSAITRCDNAT